MQINQIIIRLFILTLIFLLSSCSPFKPQVRTSPAGELPKTFSLYTPGVEPPERWWEEFNDVELNDLIEEALAGNLTLKEAWARLNQAKALAVQSGSALYPDLSGTGGTTYGSAIAVAAAKAALEAVLTPENYARLDRFGTLLADGLQDVFEKHGFDWRAFRLGPRSGYCLQPRLPRSAAEASHSIETEMIDARRAFMANRGVWDAVASAGPQVSFAHGAEDIAGYVTLADAFLAEILRQ